VREAARVDGWEVPHAVDELACEGTRRVRLVRGEGHGVSN